MRPDANLKNLYHGPQKDGRGRKRKVAAKVNVKQIDKSKWKKCYSDQDMSAYELIVRWVTIKAEVKVIYLQSNKNHKNYDILISTDIK